MIGNRVIALSCRRLVVSKLCRNTFEPGRSIPCRCREASSGRSIASPIELKYDGCLVSG